MRSEILRANPDGSVTLPDGSKADVALADALGFMVLGGRAPTLEARADAAAKVAGARARADVLRPAPPVLAPPAPSAPRPAVPPRPVRAPIPRAATGTVLKRGALGMAGMVELPCGRIENAEAATAAGYMIEGSPAAIAFAAQVAVDERQGAILSLPEAAGRFAAACMVAASAMPLAEAGRFLAGLPEDEPSPPPVQATAPVDAEAARIAARRIEIVACAARFNRAKGYAR